MDMELIFGLFVVGLPVFMLAFAWAMGVWVTRRHEADLAQRELAVAHILIHNSGRLQDATTGPHPPMMITSEVTLGVDHFRGFLGQWKSLFGGQVRSYQMVLDRARREVVMRMLEQANEMGYTALANLRIDFADISGSALTRRKAADISVLATGTAYFVAPKS